MSIGKELYFSFIGIICLFIVLGVVMIMQMKNTSTEYDKLIDKNIQQFL